MANRRHPTWIALLRGVNVGRAKRVAMADLRSLLEGLGYTDVRTLLNSGNAVFGAPARATAAALARAIETAMRAKLGVEARVFVLAADTLAELLAAHPLRAFADDDAKLLVAVLAPDVERRVLDALAARDWVPDGLALGPDAAYLWCASGVLDSPVSQAFAKALGDRATTRNWATMNKLAALAARTDEEPAA
jgi:uncharacterized protein (DUF1697 family)